MTIHTTTVPTRTVSAKTLGALAVAGLVIAFSLSSTLVKRAHTPGVLVAFWRLATVSVVWNLYLRTTGRRVTLRDVRQAFVPGIFFGLNLANFFAGATKNSVADEEHIYAISEAMREEYEAIAAAGFQVQVDDAWLGALWDRIGLDMGLDGYRKYCQMRCEALNYALRNIPEEQIRYHLCWGSWHGPHSRDLPLPDIIDVMLSVKAQTYSIEAANVRHEHEVSLWEDTKLPDGKILAPGVVTHSTPLIEHPQLVADRIQRFAKLVGRENVIASTDCGLGLRCHPQIAWAKLKTLTDGAALASTALWS